MTTLAGQRCLVTGGLGFLGSNLVLRLVELGADVTVLDCLASQAGGAEVNVAPVASRIHLVRGDQRDADLLAELVAGQDVIYNLAGLVSHVDSLSAPLDDLEMNVRAQLVLLETVRRAAPRARVLYAGTRGQYGAAPDHPVTESQPMRPLDVNGVNKMAGEAHHLLYQRLYGVRATSLRLSNTYGPRHQMRHSRQGVINWFLRQVMDDGTVSLYGDGGQVRDAVFVDDVVDAFLLCAGRDETIGHAFNLGGHPHSLRHIAQTMIRVVGRGRVTFVPFPDEARRIEIGSYTADASKLRAACGWQAAIPLEDGLRRTAAFYTAHRAAYW